MQQERAVKHELLRWAADQGQHAGSKLPAGMGQGKHLKVPDSAAAASGVVSAKVVMFPADHQVFAQACGHDQDVLKVPHMPGHGRLTTVQLEAVSSPSVMLAASAWRACLISSSRLELSKPSNFRSR